MLFKNVNDRFEMKIDRGMYRKLNFPYPNIKHFMKPLNSAHKIDPMPKKSSGNISQGKERKILEGFSLTLWAPRIYKTFEVA